MIHVIASIRIKPGRTTEYIEILKNNVPLVLAENGCRGYEPTIDTESGLEIQSRESDVVTIIEKWEAVDALHAHLKTPHMLAYRRQVADMVDSISVKVLRPA